MKFSVECNNCMFVRVDRGTWLLIRKMSAWLFWMSVVLVYVSSSLVAGDASNDSESSSNRFVQEMIVRAHQKLSTGLYKAFAREEGNLVISPWSVMSLLTVTYMVAAGRTATEIGDHLRINLLRRKEILAGFKHVNNILSQSATGNGSIEDLLSLNGAYVGEKAHPSRRLQKHLRDNLNTYISHIINSDSDENTSNSSLAGSQRLQELVREKTHGLMDGALPTADGALAARMSLWLFSILYFEGTWRIPFNPRQTHYARFITDTNKEVNVPTMTTKGRFPRNHINELQMTILELPYGDSGRHSLFILLPDQVDGLPALEKRLRYFTLESMLTGDHWARPTKVFLPKFKFQTSVRLNDVMKKLGFKRMFSPTGADFSRLAPKSDRRRRDGSLYVQSMLQKAVIEVNEEGTKAASVTTLNVVHRRYVHYLRVDHPFLFVLRDKTLGINLFMGRVTDPRQLAVGGSAQD